MIRALRVAGPILALSVLAAGGAFLWASSGVVPEDQLGQKTTYEAEYASADRDTFTVMTYHLNRLQGVHSSSRTDSQEAVNMDRATALIQEVSPDILGVQSVGLGHPTHQLDALAGRLGMPEAVQAVTWNERYRPSLLFDQTGPLVSGQALLSRFPIRRFVRKEFAQAAGSVWRGAFAPNRLVQIAALDVGGWPLIVMNVHLEKIDVETREEQARTVRNLYRRLSRQGFPILVIGTLNGLVPSAAMPPSAEGGGAYVGDETMEVLLDKTNLQPALSAAAAQMAGKDLGTYPADNPDRTIDYILYRPEVVVPTDAEVVCNAGSEPPSDHCAVAMSFLLPRPKDKLPDERIPDERLPSLERFLGEESDK